MRSSQLTLGIRTHILYSIVMFYVVFSHFLMDVR